MLTAGKYGARLAVNKGKGALRINLRAPFSLYEVKIARGRKPAALKCRIMTECVKYRERKLANKEETAAYQAAVR